MTYRDRGAEYIANRLSNPESTTRIAEIREQIRKVDDIEYAYSRARLLWSEDTARIWFESANAFLGGSRPLDVLRTDGASSVLLALDAEMGGGAA
ncbi:antitoxin Xre/MbcA/ParS toxin-binding domain-containing protein [Mycobacterium sp. 360MFTsu5.1]|uniref:antitoxin Xre/MbcA/ParS toxin-binding domain-containing protein n=1 Tax=Mycobacterium sp. 360MFTsu5.1 TaxID=1172186 RepID=UPI00035F75E3|nr:antitoxin Xre/MbcA/ParS toxin-binding domain-containing protein [Mycobacterium sp. 360MFTsu5.1]